MHTTDLRSRQPRCRGSCTDPPLRAALALLLGGFECAEILARPAEEFACTLVELQKTRVSEEMLGALLGAGHLERLPAGPRPSTNGCASPTARAPCGRPDHRFVLTTVGAAVARLVLRGANYSHPALSNRLTDAAPAESNVLPYWDAAFRELWFQGQVVRRFARQASNQEWILAGFQELGLPQRMDDPLPRDRDVDQESRLRDTVKSLNRGQKPAAIRFAVDASGHVIRWNGPAR